MPRTPTNPMTVYFECCAHTSPPKVKPKRTPMTIDLQGKPIYVGSCRECTLGYAHSQEAMFLEHYNSDIQDLEARLAMYKGQVDGARETPDSGASISTTINEKIFTLQRKRDAEITNIWGKVIKEWDGIKLAYGGKYKGSEEGRKVINVDGKEWSPEIESADKLHMPRPGAKA